MSQETEKAVEQSTPGRKIKLDRSIYCLASQSGGGGDPSCDHDFEDAPSRKSDYGATWTCTRCGREISFDVWD